jgi:hypothetical protein
MKKKLILVLPMVFKLCCSLVHGGEEANDPTSLRVVRHGDYTYTYLWTNRVVTYVDASEFWPGTWKENADGWRVQLCVYSETNYWAPQEGVMYPVSTNLMLSVEWGSTQKNSGSGYYLSPNGKFARFELRGADGNVIPPNPDAGTNLLERHLIGNSVGSSADMTPRLAYLPKLPKWVAPASGSLVADLPRRISSDAFPHLKHSGDSDGLSTIILGEISSVTNRPPSVLSLLRLDEVYSVPNEGDYTLTVQPVLYKKQTGTNVFDRVDLPSITTKVHLVPNPM